jgi:hypothetical protein
MGCSTAMSYERMGVAELAIYSSGSITSNSCCCSSAVYLLSGRTQSRSSIPRTTVLVHPKAPGKVTLSESHILKVLRGMQNMQQLPEHVQEGDYYVVRDCHTTVVVTSKRHQYCRVQSSSCWQCLHVD